LLVHSTGCEEHIYTVLRSLALLYGIHPDADSPLMRIQSLDGCKLHYRAGQTLQALCSQVGGCDVLQERAKVDSGVLLCVAVGC